ncbi:MAG: uroporphyrinogen-III synthase [Kiloniellales bacterium]|nr:uroporphyrinogen-III synthase [Kiloniellales bacterium]
MKVLVTRPEADAAPLAAELAARGHSVAIEPLLTIVAKPDAAVDLSGVQAIALTSANGARVLAERTARRNLPVFAVGDATAAAARAAGFPAVESAGGDVVALAELLAARLDPAEGAVFHPAARHLAGDLQGRLEAKGFAVRRAVLYESEPSPALSEATEAALRGGRIDVALFFSPRTGKTFVRLLAESRLTAVCNRMFALCLSDAVAEDIKRLPWRALYVAAQPTQAALLDSLAALEGSTDRPME